MLVKEVSANSKVCRGLMARMLVMHRVRCLAVSCMIQGRGYATKQNTEIIRWDWLHTKGQGILDYGNTYLLYITFS